MASAAAATESTTGRDPEGPPGAAPGVPWVATPTSILPRRPAAAAPVAPLLAAVSASAAAFAKTRRAERPSHEGRAVTGLVLLLRLGAGPGGRSESGRGRAPRPGVSCSPRARSRRSKGESSGWGAVPQEPLIGRKSRDSGALWLVCRRACRGLGRAILCRGEGRISRVGAPGLVQGRFVTLWLSPPIALRCSSGVSAVETSKPRIPVPSSDSSIPTAMPPSQRFREAQARELCYPRGEEHSQRPVSCKG